MQPRGTREIVDNQNIKHKIRPHNQVHNHRFLTNDPHQFRKKFVNLKLSTKTENNILKVTCKIKNKNIGHSFPTGSPIRNAILIIDTKDKNGNNLRLIKGSRLPNYAGDLKDKPGKLFAKILSETSQQYATTHGEGGIKFRELANKFGIPAQQWWNVFIVRDTRIKAGKEDISIYEFELGDVNNVEIAAKLIWRNTWPGLAKLKGFELIEDVITEKTISF